MKLDAETQQSHFDAITFAMQCENDNRFAHAEKASLRPLNSFRRLRRSTVDGWLCMQF